METPKWKLVLEIDPVSTDYAIHVEPDNVFVGLSLVALADRVLRRMEARAEAASAIKNSPLIFPGSLPATKGPLG